MRKIYATITKSGNGKSGLTVSQKLSVISQRLRTGDMTAVATKTGYDTSHVSRVLRGLRSNPSGEIVNAAYSRVSKRKVTA